MLSHRKSGKVQVKESVWPKTHMGRHWPPAPDPPGLCDDTSSASVERLFILFRPLFLFPIRRQQPANSTSTITHAHAVLTMLLCYYILLVESMRPYCAATLHHHTAPPRQIDAVLPCCCCCCCCRGEQATCSAVQWSDQKMR